MASSGRDYCRHGRHRARSCARCQFEHSLTEIRTTGSSSSQAAVAYITHMQESFGSEQAWQASILTDMRSRGENPYTGRPAEGPTPSRTSNTLTQRQDLQRSQCVRQTRASGGWSFHDSVRPQEDQDQEEVNESESDEATTPSVVNYGGVVSRGTSRRSAGVGSSSSRLVLGPSRRPHPMTSNTVLFRWETEPTLNPDRQRLDERWSHPQPPYPWSVHNRHESRENTLGHEFLDTEFLRDVEGETYRGRQ
ncbi:hypothetical protein EV356DRAFT_529998 [Viridothelium virens]|uniref:Uncharacterized protein n=1 Tax=Viridothelium virens TaxID=1048519 RepID=A0A6A6HHR4_VIRVR|nr:hypothetical protein EV356DRAFT_529998 [Viridothelium virens]